MATAELEIVEAPADAGLDGLYEVIRKGPLPTESSTTPQSILSL